MRALIVVGLAACSFHPGSLDDGDGGGIGGEAGGGGGSSCAWSYTPTNFKPCDLPAPMPLTVSSDTTLDTAATSLPKLVLTQMDGTQITVIHLTQLSVTAPLTVTGTGVVFAVDGDAIVSNTIVAVGGSNNPMQCGTAKGGEASDSTNANGGGGGGGGAGGGEVGGNGGNGGGTQAGNAGGRGARITSNLSPLRGGCAGGNGGRPNAVGTKPMGGRGGGALQISSNLRVSVEGDGKIDANGRGGNGGNAALVGGAGGGSGGGIFLEAPTIDLAFLSRVCADGGSGGEGAGTTANDGQTGTCNGSYAMTAVTVGTTGGLGGSGSYALKTAGGNAGTATGAGGGGGGGGGVGWIRIKSPNVNVAVGAVITPFPMN